MNLVKRFFVPKKPLFKWFVKRAFLSYLFIGALLELSNYISNIPTKTKEPTQAQWEGYSKCLENRYKTFSAYGREEQCRREFNIPRDND